MDWIRLDHNIKLVSIHIPKTAGTSFQKILWEQYGAKHCLRLDFVLKGPDIKPRNEHTRQLLAQYFENKSIPETIRVVHGHFTYQDIHALLKDDNSIQWVSWVREPLDRVKSNYNYLCQRLEDEITHSELSPAILKRLRRTLVEFASLPRQRRLYQKYLAGPSLEDYDFIGIFEKMSSDLIALGEKLNWDRINTPHANPTRYPVHSELDEDTRERLSQLLADEIKLYQQIRGLRNET